MDGMNVEQQFSLSWNNFHGNVSRELSALLGSGTLADVTLAVGGELLQAHRLVLAICSPYFKRMFQSNPHHHPIVVLRDVTHKAMRDLLQFMYHGEVSVKREDLTSFIATAELLQIKGLTNKETEDEDREQELPKTAPEPTAPQRLTEMVSDDDTIETKTKLLNEKIQRLKRASEFLQSNYCHAERPEKRPRSDEKGRFDKFYDETPADMSYSEMQKHASEEEKSEGHYDASELDVKTECDDGDIIVTDAMQYATKQFDGDGNKDLMPALQDDASGLSSIFMDLKSIVSGKYPYRSPVFAYDGRCRGGSLTTIPQKEDGKKKYPQRSCRSCWKVGKRRDTRFMCNYCGTPFCKTPCFEVHVRSERMKAGSFEGEFALT